MQNRSLLNYQRLYVIIIMRRKKCKFSPGENFRQYGILETNIMGSNVAIIFSDCTYLLRIFCMPPGGVSQ